PTRRSSDLKAAGCPRSRPAGIGQTPDAAPFGRRVQPSRGVGEGARSELVFEAGPDGTAQAGLHAVLAVGDVELVEQVVAGHPDAGTGVADIQVEARREQPHRWHAAALAGFLDLALSAVRRIVLGLALILSAKAVRGIGRVGEEGAAIGPGGARVPPPAGVAFDAEREGGHV